MSIVVGSGIWSKQKAEIPHLNTGEVADLRQDLAKVLAGLAAVAVVEYTNPVAADAAGLKAATTTSVAIQSYTAADLLSAGKAALLADGRNVTFTTAGGTPADAPANVVVNGTDMDGKAQTETIAVAQTATIATGVKIFKTITSVVYEAGQGTGATVSIGFGALLGLPLPIKSRAGLAGIWREIAAGAVVTNGVVVAANRSYAPNAAPNGTNDYALYYEYDATVITDG